MGAKPSKPLSHSPQVNGGNYDTEKLLGKDIVDKIRLRTTDVNTEQAFQQFQSTKFAKRLKMDAEVGDCVSWNDIPKLFAQPPATEACKLAQKYFKLLVK